jgi:sugar phosphate isomerase/epimerase
MSIDVVGKCPPTPEELAAAAARGFGAVEIYLERSHLDAFDRTLESIRDAPVEAVSVHTPHVPIDEPAYFHAADRLAVALSAYLVVHSNRVVNAFTPKLAELGFEAQHGYENNPGTSLRHLQAMILDPGYDLVVDTAHLFMAHADPEARLAELFEEHGDRIEVVHLCDASLTQDGLAFGTGSVDLRALSRLVMDCFHGTVVLEVMPERQAAALAAVERWTG